MTNTTVQLIIAVIQLLSTAVLIGLAVFIIRLLSRRMDEKELMEEWEKEHNPHLPGR